jgi:GTP pyrophosphokinase
MIEALIRRIQEYAPGADTAMVLDAYQYAALCHRGQTRKSGEDYLVHPISVASILADLKMDVETIVTGLLHDTIEDTLASYEEIEQRFGKAVAEMVDGVTKLSKLVYKGKVEEQAENFRKFVLAFGKDLRVVLVKIADRLHNMRTLEHHKAEKQKTISRETLEIYAPLVHRLGLDIIKTELEDLCFRHLWPEEYAALKKELDEGQPDRDAYVAATCNAIKNLLTEKGIKCEVSGRVKHLYSIFRKIQKRSKNLEEIYDLLAFRVMVPDRDNCYVALGFIHGEFIPVRARLKDYIAVPKPNGYQSLHTTVMGPENRMIEVQIRTGAMHTVAETGIAAHWRYKNGKLAVTNQQLEAAARLRSFIQMARDIEDPADFMEAARSDLSATIHVFTPEKDVILLPDKATALDFAYYVHTEVGNRAQGAKVNGKLVQLRTELRPGDSVEIVTNAEARPTREWLEWAKTHRALEKIRKRLRELLGEGELPWGQRVLDVALSKLGSSLKRVQQDTAVLERLKNAGTYSSLDELITQVAAGKVAPGEAARMLVAPPEPTPAPSITSNLTTGISNFFQKFRKQTENAIVVSGQTDILVDYARCCHPMKGEDIIGYITRGRGLSVHRADCSMVKGLDADRFVPVAWDGSTRTLHQGLLRMVADDRPGLLAEISSLCASAHINLWRADVRTEGDQAICELGVAVHDVVQLSQIIKKLKAIKGVISIERAV